MALLELKNIIKEFGNHQNTVQVLKGVSLSIEEGDFIAIIGQSGSGKTTLMNILGCLDTPSFGSYKIDGVYAFHTSQIKNNKEKEIPPMNADQLAVMRCNKFGFIFQKYNLLGALSARENVALPAIYAGEKRSSRLQRASQLLSKLGLQGKENNHPSELSGGQQQRVSIARSIMNGGKIILADEPTGALDSKNGCMVMDILTNLHSKGHTIILVTHDTNIANYANRIIEIKDGQILSDTRKEIKKITLQNTTVTQKKTKKLSRYKDQISEAFQMSIQAIVSHKLRSLLTMLGIIIGIAAVVSVVALGRGSQTKILESISQINTNTIAIFPGKGWGDTRAQRIKTLTIADANILEKQSYINSVTPETLSSGMLSYHNTSLTAQLNGVGRQYFDVEGLQIATGRFFNETDTKEDRQVVVIDHNTRQQLFPRIDEKTILGKTILFRKKPLVIIGIIKKKKSNFGAARNSLNLYAPYTTVMHKITGAKHISAITAKITDGVDSSAAEKSITQLLEVRHGSIDFFTFSSDAIQQTIKATTSTMTLMISSIALISLIVGGIGVMNIMLVSVTERTSEIGIRMAIGAQRLNILHQFLIEAMLICLVGGVLGVLSSVTIAAVFNHFVHDFAMSFSTTAIVLAVFCSSAIGIIFGYIPARNAARLNPIEALSRE